ncbi:MAG TPA: helix-turn-helix domain-containing protein [Mycobacteriales bacterium]
MSDTYVSTEPVSPTALASALPRREAGTRSRGGNAMARTRAGLLDGALRAVVRDGVRHTTMNDIAAEAGIAKATLYNHFRTKNDVLAALVESQVRVLAAECQPMSLVDALEHAARRICEHPAVRRVVRTEPKVVAAMLTAGPHSVGWQAAATELRSRLAPGCGAEAVELVLRWLVTFVARPARPEVIRATAEVVGRALTSTDAS